MNEKQYLNCGQLKSVELNLLIKFAQYCEQKGLIYCLCGGTLLGAIRHSGFIPWDDDIDVMMPREDYIRFIQLQHEKREFDYYTASDKTGELPILKLIDKSVKVESLFSKGQEVSYAWVDVFPIDGMYKERYKCRLQIFLIWMLQRISNSIRMKTMKGSTWIRTIAKVAVFFPAKLIGAQRVARWIDMIAMKVPFSQAEYVGGLTWGYGMKEKMPKKQWLQREKVQFEGHEFWAPGCWDFYLKSLFGNYMELPPEEKRIGHIVKVWSEESKEIKQRL